MFRGGRGGGTPNRGRRPGGSQQNTPRDSKPEPKSTPMKETDKPADAKQGERPRSRSPIDRKDKNDKKDEASTTTAAAADDQSETAVVEKVVEKKYTGRPGEKKFNGRCRLFVANLTNPTSEDDLKELFSDFGETGEVYVNKEKGFGFIRLDYRHNAEIAKLTLDKKLIKGRNISVRYATHASAIELHGLDNYASNEFIERAMSSFGAVERCVVVCDDRGRSKGYAIVEFEWKKSATKVLDRLKDEMFCLGRLPKPVFAKPWVMQDEEEGVPEESLERLDGLEQERSHGPRFIPPNSFEYTWAKRWRDLFIEEQDRKAKLEQEVTDARCKLEFEMEAALRQQEASRICEELQRRQEELRMLEEDMMRRQEADMRILEQSRQREMAARGGHPEQLPQNETEMHLNRENMNRQHDFMQLRQRADNIMHNDSFNDMRGPPDGRGYPIRQQMGPPQDLMSSSFGEQGGPPQGYQGHQGGDHGWHQGGQQGGGPRPPHPDFRENQQQQQQRGPPPRDSRDLPARDLPARDLPRDVVKDLASDKTGEATVPVIEIDA